MWASLEEKKEERAALWNRLHWTRWVWSTQCAKLRKHKSESISAFEYLECLLGLLNDLTECVRICSGPTFSGVTLLPLWVEGLTLMRWHGRHGPSLSYSASFWEIWLLLPPTKLPAPMNCGDILCYWPRTVSDYGTVAQKTFKCLVPYQHSINTGWLIKCRLIIIQEYLYSSWKQWHRVGRTPNLGLVAYPANLPAKWFGAGWKVLPEAPFPSL